MSKLSKSSIEEMARASAQSIINVVGRDFNPRVGIILGTGGNQIKELARCPDSVEFRYDDIDPPIPVSEMSGHEGSFLALPDAGILICAGRQHTFRTSIEKPALDPDEIALKVGYLPAVLSYLNQGKEDGAIITTDAIGGNVHKRKDGYILEAGDIGLITGYHTLGRGVNIGQAIGNPFLDRRIMMDPKMIQLAKEAADKNGIKVFPGHLYAVHGPDLETDPEYIILALLGFPFVGMTGSEMEVWSSLRRRLDLPLNNLAIGIVSDNTLPTFDGLKRYLDDLLPSHPFFSYGIELLKLSQRVGSNETTHEGNIRAVKATIPKIAALLHTYVGLSRGVEGNLVYTQSSPLFKYN